MHTSFSVVQRYNSEGTWNGIVDGQRGPFQWFLDPGYIALGTILGHVKDAVPVGSLAYSDTSLVTGPKGI